MVSGRGYLQHVSPLWHCLSVTCSGGAKVHACAGTTKAKTWRWPWREASASCTATASLTGTPSVTDQHPMQPVCAHAPSVWGTCRNSVHVVSPLCASAALPRCAVLQASSLGWQSPDAAVPEAAQAEVAHGADTCTAHNACGPALAVQPRFTTHPPITCGACEGPGARGNQQQLPMLITHCRCGCVADVPSVIEQGREAVQHTAHGGRARQGLGHGAVARRLLLINHGLRRDIHVRGARGPAGSAIE